jgi:hypothetical protein
MSLVARRHLQDGGLDLDEIAHLQVILERRPDAAPRPQQRLTVGVDARHPPP